jgi:hypothetical protein
MAGPIIDLSDANRETCFLILATQVSQNLSKFFLDKPVAFGVRFTQILSNPNLLKERRQI